MFEHDFDEMVEYTEELLGSVEVVIHKFNEMENSLEFINQVFDNYSHKLIIENILNKCQRRIFWEEKLLSEQIDDQKIFDDLENKYFP